MYQKKSRFSVFFLTPAFVLYTVFIILPVLSSTYYSFTEWNGAKAPIFSGLGNYIRLANDSSYWQVVRNTLTLVVYTVVFQISLGLLFAYLLFWTTRGFRFFRTVYFMPVVVAPVAIGIMFSLFYNGDLGPVNKFFEAAGLPFLAHNWLSDMDIVLYSVMTPQVWQYIGLFVVIFLAGLRSIPAELFESARIDGASAARIFFAIAIPLIWEIVVICIILAVTGSLKSFDHSWAITKGGPGNASSFIATLMYKRAFMDNQFGYGSAITMTILVYAVTFTVLFRRFVVKENVEY